MTKPSAMSSTADVGDRHLEGRLRVVIGRFDRHRRYAIILHCIRQLTAISEHSAHLKSAI